MRGNNPRDARRVGNPQALRVRKLIDKEISDESWGRIIRALKATALSGDKGAARCARLLMHYCFELSDSGDHLPEDRVLQSPAGLSEHLPLDRTEQP